VRRSPTGGAGVHLVQPRPENRLLDPADAKETVIHRVDAELADGEPLAAIPADLAADGIDELLIAFGQYRTANWPEAVAELVTPAGNRTVSVVTPQRSWLLRLTTTGVQVEESGADSPNATVKGPGTGRAALAVGAAAGRTPRSRATRKRSRCCARY